MSPHLLSLLLQNLKPMTTNVKHPYGTLYLHNVLSSFLLVISERNSPRYLCIITLRWWMKEQSHREGLGHIPGARLVLSPGSCCLHLTHSTLLDWIASDPPRSALFCSGRLASYQQIPLSLWRTGKPGVLQSMGSQEVGHDWATEQQLCLTFEFGYCRALGRNPMGGGGDGWSICLPALFLSVHIRIAATLGQKSPFLSSSWLYLGRW